MPNTAKFTIDASASSPPGYDAAAGATLTLQLEDLPVVDFWSVQFSVTQSTSGAPTLTFSPSNGQPATPGGAVTVTMPGSGVHSYVITCICNGGVNASGAVVAAYTYSRIIAIRSAAGFRKITPAERTEYDETYGWVNAFNELVGGGLASAATTLTGSAPIMVDGDNAEHDLSTDRTISILAASGVAAGSMSAAHFTLLNAATATPTASTIPKWDGSKALAASAFKGEGTVASAGLVRGANDATLLAAKDSGGNDLTVLAVSSSDILTIGDDTHLANMSAALKSAGAFTVSIAGVSSVDVDADGIVLHDATQSTTDPVDAARIQSVDGAVKVRSVTGIVTTVAPAGRNASTLRLLDIDANVTQTTDATPATLLAVAIPDHALFEIEWKVKGLVNDMARNTGAWFRRVSRGHREGGSFAIDQAVTPFADGNTTGVSPGVTISTSGTDVILQVTGDATKTFEWSGTAHIDIHVP